MPVGTPTTDPFRAWLEEVGPVIEDALERALVETSAGSAPPALRVALRHALLGGGKRVRPALTLLVCEASGGLREAALPAAVACELVHAYSLVHDDLPCMDDDLLRRGRPSVHAAHGEALAVLAGDALQTLAFEVLAAQPDAQAARAQAALLARCSGAAGMVGGQVLDMESEGRPSDEPAVRAIHRAKTGALFEASVRMGALAAGVDDAPWGPWAEAVGRLFQATDDLLDATRTTDELGKTAGKDSAAGKATLVAALGADGARAAAEREAEAADAALQAVSPSLRYDALAGLPSMLLGRCR